MLRTSLSRSSSSSTTLLRRSLASTASTRAHTPTLASRATSVHATPTDAMPPLTTPDWHDWRMNVPSVIPEDSVMFRNQAKLPKLPLPELDDTLSRLVRSCQALAEQPAAAETVKHKVDAFRRGPGPKLQALLNRKRDQPAVRNWLARDWDEQAYMAYRDSVVINVSYYFGFKRLPQSTRSKATEADPAYVAASIATTALEFRRLVTQGHLEPELVGRSPEDGELCMESYKWAFNACRLPASPSDYAVKTREDDPAAQCFVVVKRNRFYRIPFADEHGRHYSTEALRQAIQNVIDGASRDAAPPVGILTGVNRDHWAEAYGHLAADPANVPTIRTIQQSAFVICLDEAEPTEIVDFSRKLWTGEKEAGNRWWDKPLQWVVYRNGESGFIGEHSCMDGTPTARLNDYLSKRLLSGESPVEFDNALSSVPKAEALPFQLDSTAKEQIEAAETEFAAHIAPYDVHYTLYTRYGKEGIKKMKTSPDGWVQMLFQMAYYLTFQRLCGTYEAAQTRRYQLGRTETVRILTPEVVAFVKAVASDDTPTADKLALFRAAIAQHGKDMKLASAGMGIDRHLFGLKMLAAAPDGHEFTDADRKAVMEGDGLFADPLVKESGTWKMSTSQIYIENAPSYGWGPVAEGGLGIPYMIHPHTLQLTVTCKNDVPGAEFVRNFEKAADLLMDLHEAEAARKPGKLDVRSFKPAKSIQSITQALDRDALPRTEGAQLTRAVSRPPTGRRGGSRHLWVEVDESFSDADADATANARVATGLATRPFRQHLADSLYLVRFKLLDRAYEQRWTTWGWWPLGLGVRSCGLRKEPIVFVRDAQQVAIVWETNTCTDDENWELKWRPVVARTGFSAEPRDWHAATVAVETLQTASPTQDARQVYTARLTDLASACRVEYELALWSSSRRRVLRSRRHSFPWTCPPVETRPATLHIACVADNQFNVRTFRRVLLAMTSFARRALPPYYFAASAPSRRPHLLLHAGDVVQEPDDLAQWQTDFWDALTRSGLPFSLGQETPVLLARGNHDWDSTGRNAYTGGVDGPTAPGRGTYFAFSPHRRMRILVLDSNLPTEAEQVEQERWLADELGDAAWDDASLKVAVVHTAPWIEWWDHAAWTEGRESQWSAYVRRRLIPQLADAGCALVLSGHSHAYTRGFVPHSLIGDLARAADSRSLPSETVARLRARPWLHAISEEEDSGRIDEPGLVAVTFGGAGGTLDSDRVEDWHVMDKSISGRYHFGWIAVSFGGKNGQEAGTVDRALDDAQREGDATRAGGTNRPRVYRARRRTRCRRGEEPVRDVVEWRAVGLDGVSELDRFFLVGDGCV
ncbi:hypothetical protein JCM3774_004189 [Rhodotorula dairenensis]